MSTDGANDLRAALLREMGIRPLWRLRGVRDAGRDEHAPAAAVATKRTRTPLLPPDAAAAGSHEISSARVPVPAVRPEPSPAARPPTVAPTPVVERGPLFPQAGQPQVAGLDWEALEEAMRACQACGLCKGRRQVVPGVGLRSAQAMFVGEGPGVEEDRRGEPFVGPAGKLLDSMLASIGLSRHAREAENGVYIANAVKCHPPHNRTPSPEEIQICQPFLARQIELVQPRLLVALGRPAAQSLLGHEVKISAVRGRLFRHGDIPLIVTYHPAYLLRNPADKARAWEDLCLIRRTLHAVP